MSLRTKLLTAIVGLNAAILFLALTVLLHTEGESAPATSAEVVRDLVELGAGLSGPHDARDRRHADEIVRALRESGAVGTLVVVEEDPVEGRSRIHAWNAAEFLEVGGHADEMPEGPARHAAIDAFTRARQDPSKWAASDSLALVLPERLDRGGRRGIVLGWTAPAARREGIQLVYVVLVAGVVLLSAVAFWLVSRSVVRPLAGLADAADRIARGEAPPDLLERGTNDEIDRTVSAFNRMTREIGEYQAHLEDRVLSALGRIRKAEQHLAIAQRLAATGKLASGVAHEINNPLGGMKNAVRSLARGDLPPDKVREYLELIGEGLGRVEETVKKFLSFTPRRLEPRPTDLADVARKAATLARHRIDRSGARLLEDLPEPGAASVFGDPHELQQVALNLLINAADAVAGRPEAWIRLGVERRGTDAVLQVADNGVGLSPEDQDRCFDLFFTTKDVGEGSGLGLAVAHTIVTNHGGRIELESRVGEGATFRVVLPAEEGRSGSKDPDPSGGNGAGTPAP